MPQQQKKRLTEALIRKLDGPRLVYDDIVPGLAIRVYPSGHKAFLLAYHVDGRERRLTIGSFPSWSPPQAREKAKELRRDVDSGGDPLAMRARRKGEPTFAELVERYFEVKGQHQKGSAEYRRMLDRDVLPILGPIKAKDIQRRDLRELVERKAQSAPIMGNRVFETIRRVFAFAVEQEIVEVSPCYMVKRPAPERSKDRVLSADELRAFWTLLDGPAFTPQSAAALRLILLTAARPGEVCGLTWAEIDFENGWWTLPSERSKNGLSHRVPLNPTALEVLRSVERTSEFVFPSPKPGGHVHRNSLALAIRRARSREQLDVEPFSPHDLRRTAATMMASAGIDHFVVRRVLNHVEPGITKVYERHGYDREKRRALDVLDRQIRAILKAAPSTVVEFPKNAS